MFKFSLGNEQERAKSAFGHALLQFTTQIVKASNESVRGLERMKGALTIRNSESRMRRGCDSGDEIYNDE